MQTSTSRSTTGPDWSRRDFLRVGALGGFSALAAGPAGPSPTIRRHAHPAFGKAQSCLLIFLAGGPSQLDTFDPKPDAPSEIRGEFRAIDTRVPGLRFCEHLPGLAHRADRLTVIRTMGHDDSIHGCACYRMLTGQPYPRDPGLSEHLAREDHPHVGSILAAAVADSEMESASFVTVPDLLGARGAARAGQHAGILGPGLDPLIVPLGACGDDGTTAAQPAPGRDPRSSLARLLRREPDRVLDRYGRNRFGRSVLLGRRLIEAGVRLVQVNWSSRVEAGWDTHSDGFAALKDDLLPPADRALSALLDDLSASGLLGQTLVIVMGEFGRSPRITPTGGRGHWPSAFSILLAGAAIPGGRSLGATDRQGAFALDRPIPPEALTATILFALGVESGTAVDCPQVDPRQPSFSAPLLELWS